MKIANSVKITVFIKEEEDFDKVKRALLQLFPFNIEEEKIELKESSATGFNEKKIRVIEVLLEKDRHIEAFLKNINDNLSEETREWLLNQLERRIDDDCNLFLRLSKEKWIEEKYLWVTDQGNCFHIKINVAAFPKKKENALEIIRNLFKVQG
ncbi:hypothetical protein KY342_01075 [Candidatus Woesearchaeota archaeon]|nr:hypothetical protein [Candidatus Woesearchaeota archaeon]